MADRTLDEARLKSWIGLTETDSDLIDAGRARLLQATLDRVPDLRDGDELPPLWHWIYFPMPVRISALGRDGHPRRGGFLPPVDLPRRMWAGGRFEFRAPIRLGERIDRVSAVEDVTLKQGRSGKLCFVTVRHAFNAADGSLRFAEEHDIVYREDPRPGARPAAPESAPESAPTGAQWQCEVEPSPVLLFRYSALTFNGHRIHYDRAYCREVEGYPGLVVHGPLIATLLADLMARQRPRSHLRRFRFRAVAPLFDTEPFLLCGRSDARDSHRVELWAETPRRGLAMAASAILSE